MLTFPLTFTSADDDAGQRLDQYLVSKLPEVSRARVQQLIARGEVLVGGSAARASLRLKGAEEIQVTGPPQAPPLRALAEEIPLDIVYEDDDLAIVNKPAGMMVHAGAGATDDARNRGTLVNALLHHFGALSGVGGELRPGIVHRLDRATSGLMVVAKNDESHRRLAQQFSARERAGLAWTEALTLLPGGISDEVYAQASAEFSEKDLMYLTSAIASINVWNRFGAAYRWTPPQRQNKAGAAA